MFDYPLKNLNKNIRDEIQDPKSLISTETEFPLEYIEDGFIHCTDGSIIVMITFPGVDISVMNTNEQRKFAEGTTTALSTLNPDHSEISILPEHIDGTASLVLCRDREKELHKQVGEAKTEHEQAAKKIQLNILHYIIADEEEASTNVEQTRVKAYVFAKYTFASNGEIINEINNFTATLSEISNVRSVWIRSTDKILDIMETYINDKAPVGQRFMKPVVMMPDFTPED